MVYDEVLESWKNWRMNSFDYKDNTSNPIAEFAELQKIAEVQEKKLNEVEQKSEEANKAADDFVNSKRYNHRNFWYKVEIILSVPALALLAYSIYLALTNHTSATVWYVASTAVIVLDLLIHYHNEDTNRQILKLLKEAKEANKDFGIQGLYVDLISQRLQFLHKYVEVEELKRKSSKKSKK